MCYEFEREYWLRRAEQVAREMKEREERTRQASKPKPAAPAEQPRAPGEREPVPA